MAALLDKDIIRSFPFHSTVANKQRGISSDLFDGKGQRKLIGKRKTTFKNTTASLNGSLLGML